MNASLEIFVGMPLFFIDNGLNKRINILVILVIIFMKKLLKKFL
jgi:hypothetical protein